MAAIRSEVQTMNTREQAAQKIMGFLESPDPGVLLLNGTHQNEKHVLALAAVFRRCPGPATALFRVNTKQNAGLFLSNAGISRVPAPGKCLNVEGCRLYVDTINSQSWKRTPHQLDVAVVYPVDSLGFDKGGECVEDLRRRGAQKILLVTWTDNRDFAWVDHYNPARVTYDAEAERPEYHTEMKTIEGAASSRDVPRNLPAYARKAPPERLIRLHCDRCRHSRWAELDQPYPGIQAIHNAASGQYRAKCLACGAEATDNYNWYGR
jgi:hypothetical protein